MVDEDLPGEFDDLPVTPAPLTIDLQASPLAPLLDIDHAPMCNVLVGPAGTGKTTLVTALAEEMGWTELAATTGIAAINLGGTTINSLLGYFDTESMRQSYLAGWLNHRLRKLRDGGVKLLIVDEMSMLAKEQLSYLTSAVLDVNQDRDETEWIRVLLVGDFAQLPPVKAQYAFEASEWLPYYAPHVIRLTEIKRQSDAAFIRALQAIRRGTITPEVTAYFTPRYGLATNLRFEGTTVLAKNDEVDRLNRLRFSDLPGEIRGFTTRRDGKQRGEWKNVPEVVEMKIGTLVMILANKPIWSEIAERVLGYTYINGDLGEVVDMTENGCAIRLVRTGTVEFVGYLTREYADPEDTRKRNPRILGAITYLPLRHAYATTCHKAQGLSFDTVQISTRDHFWSTPQMLYVAFSRARTLAGLHLVGTPMDLVKKATTAKEVGPWL